MTKNQMIEALIKSEAQEFKTTKEEQEDRFEGLSLLDYEQIRDIHCCRFGNNKNRDRRTSENSKGSYEIH